MIGLGMSRGFRSRLGLVLLYASPDFLNYQTAAKTVLDTSSASTPAIQILKHLQANGFQVEIALHFHPNRDAASVQARTKERARFEL